MDLMLEMPESGESFCYSMSACFHQLKLIFAFTPAGGVATFIKWKPPLKSLYIFGVRAYICGAEPKCLRLNDIHNVRVERAWKQEGNGQRATRTVNMCP